MNFFNPVLKNFSPHCSCKDCLHAFWSRINTEHNFLICNCDLMHSLTFPNENERIVICSGSEDIIPHSDRAEQSACKKCKNALWFVTDKRRLHCFCLHLQKLVYGLDSKQKFLPLIISCNGVSPIQEIIEEEEILPTDI